MPIQSRATPKWERAPSAPSTALAAHVATYRGRIADWLDRFGLVLRVRYDLATWAAFLLDADGTLGVSPTHNPAVSDVNPENAFWISVENLDGEIISTAVNRVFFDADLVTLLRSNQLWWDRPVRPAKSINIVLREPYASGLCGTIAYGGGMWVRPDWRGMRLNRHVGSLTRLIGAANYDVDWHVALFRSSAIAEYQGTDGHLAEYPSITPCLRGYFPPWDRELDMDLGIISRRELADFADTGSRWQYPPHA